MSKIDDIRRQREAEHARNKQTAESPAPKVAKVIPIRPADPTLAPVAESSSGRGDSAAEEGKCAQCGKVRPLVGGLISQHQKGLNKLCPGSRKKPA